RLESRRADFCEKLAHYMEETGYSTMTLAPVTEMSDRTIRRMKGDDAYRPTKEMIMAVCVAMKLSIYDSRALLRASPFRLQEDSPVDAMYLKKLEYEGEYSVREWNRVLRDIGEKPIGCSRKNEVIKQPYPILPHTLSH
ncbi:MAG: hypothetical protein J6D57_03880, partial [Mogibacterium sp.]|nr:hypothetical protein [Mogibacterium sp.]